MTYTYRPKGVCSQLMQIGIEDGVVTELSVMGGCNGNLQGIAHLVKGMKVEDVVAKLEGIRCGRRPTSCPDQLAQALKQITSEAN